MSLDQIIEQDAVEMADALLSIDALTEGLDLPQVVSIWAGSHRPLALIVI